MMPQERKEIIKTKVVYWLRWIVFVPASIVISWIAYFILGFINRIAIFFYINPESILFKIYCETFESAIFAASFIYVGVLIAPCNKIISAYIMSGILISFGSVAILLFFMLEKNDYMQLYAVVVLLVAGMATSISILREQIKR